MQFERLGHEVKSVTDAESVFQNACDWNPDLIIMDIYLKMSSCGIEAAKNIRSKGIETKILFTTGNAISTTLEEIKEIKNCTIFSKPVDFELLAQYI
jgi:CheY-like chemotaxis protein